MVSLGRVNSGVIKMFSQFQFSIRQMAIKRLNVFVHHHEDIHVKVKTLVNHILKDSEYQNDLLWDHLNDQVNELIVEKKFMEKLRMELDEQKFKFNEMNQLLGEIVEELDVQKELFQQLRQQNEDLKEQRFHHAGH